MNVFFRLLLDFYESILNLFNNTIIHSISANGLTVDISLGQVIVFLLVVSMLATMFWKGAKG